MPWPDGGRGAGRGFWNEARSSVKVGWIGRPISALLILYKVLVSDEMEMSGN